MHQNHCENGYRMIYYVWEMQLAVQEDEKFKKNAILLET